MYRAYLSAGWDDPVTHLFSGTAPPERGGYHGLDYSGYCRFIRGYLGYWPEVFSWFSRLTPSIITLVAMAASVFYWPMR